MVTTQYDVLIALTVIRLSVPFSSGQWLLQSGMSCVVYLLLTFSPLFIGAMVATRLVTSLPMDSLAFSPLFVGAMVATQHYREIK